MLSPKDLDFGGSLPAAILVKLLPYWYTQHWLEEGSHWELLVFPFEELSFIFEFWAGESLITEMTLGLRRERSLLVSAALVIDHAPLVAACSDGCSGLCSAWWWCHQSREAFLSRRQFVAHLSSFSCFTFTQS